MSSNNFNERKDENRVFKKLMESKEAKDYISSLLQSREAEIKRKVLEVVKEKSANLPIDIEREGGLYAQGMHAGLDLAIDLIMTSL